MEERQHFAWNFDLYDPRISVCVWSFQRCRHLSHPPSVSLCRVQGKRKRDSYVRVLGWPVKAPLFPAPWSARLTSSSWSAAYVWTATKTPKYCPACTPSVRGELPSCFYAPVPYFRHVTCLYWTGMSDCWGLNVQIKRMRICVFFLWGSLKGCCMTVNVSTVILLSRCYNQYCIV